MSGKGIDLRCILVCRWRAASAGMIESKDSGYKCFWIGIEIGTGDVGIVLTEKWINKVFDVKHVSDHLMMIKTIVGEVIVTVLLVYAPKTGLTIAEKELFHDRLENLALTIHDLETLLICGDFNGHIGKTASGYKGIHGWYGFGKHNIDGERILKFVVANNLVVGNSKFVM